MSLTPQNDQERFRTFRRGDKLLFEDMTLDLNHFTTTSLTAPAKDQHSSGASTPIEEEESLEEEILQQFGSANKSSKADEDYISCGSTPPKELKQNVQRSDETSETGDQIAYIRNLVNRVSSRFNQGSTAELELVTLLSEIDTTALAAWKASRGSASLRSPFISTPISENEDESLEYIPFEPVLRRVSQQSQEQRGEKEKGNNDSDTLQKRLLKIRRARIEERAASIARLEKRFDGLEKTTKEIANSINRIATSLSELQAKMPAATPYATPSFPPFTESALDTLPATPEGQVLWSQGDPSTSRECVGGRNVEEEQSNEWFWLLHSVASLLLFYGVVVLVGVWIGLRLGELEIVTEARDAAIWIAGMRARG